MSSLARTSGKLVPSDVWAVALGELQQQMTAATFNSWLKDARLLDYQDGRYVIGVHNQYAKDWLENRLRSTIARTLSQVAGEEAQVSFVVADSYQPDPAEPEFPEPPGVRVEIPPDGYGGNLGTEERAALLARIQERENGHGKTPEPPAVTEDEEEGAGDGIIFRHTRTSTDPLKAFVPVSHYALRFWMPYLGVELFALHQLLSTYAYEFNELKKPAPSLKKLARKLGHSDYTKLTGRRASKRTKAVRGLLNELADHRLCQHRAEGHGRGQRQYFDFLTKVEDLPLLSPYQVAKLPPDDQEEHTRWLTLHQVNVEEWQADERKTRILPFPAVPEREEP